MKLSKKILLQTALLTLGLATVMPSMAQDEVVSTEETTNVVAVDTTEQPAVVEELAAADTTVVKETTTVTTGKKLSAKEKAKAVKMARLECDKTFNSCKTDAMKDSADSKAALAKCKTERLSCKKEASKA